MSSAEKITVKDIANVFRYIKKNTATVRCGYSDGAGNVIDLAEVVDIKIMPYTDDNGRTQLDDPIIIYHPSARQQNLDSMIETLETMLTKLKNDRELYNKEAVQRIHNASVSPD